MENVMTKGFAELSAAEMNEIDGGIFGVDDAIFWAVVGGCFVAGIGAGVAAGVSRRNRK